MKGIICTKEIYREIVPKIIQDEASWSRFLNFSAIHYKMGFENASLLYAQRPDATMVETYAGWREKGRYVRRGSKGIAVIESGYCRPYVDHVFDISNTNGRGRPEMWRLDKENEREVLNLLHAKSPNIQGYVREAVESEIYSEKQKYIENISDLCRYHDSQNPEHIYDITKAVIQSAQYMTAVRIRAEPPPVSSLLPVLATAPRLMVYGLCSTALSVAGQVLMGIENVFEMKKEKERPVMEYGKEQGIGTTDRKHDKGIAGQSIPAIRHQPHQNTDTFKRQGNGSHKRTEKAGYEQLSLSFDGGYAFCDCGRAL